MTYKHKQKPHSPDRMLLGRVDKLERRIRDLESRPNSATIPRRRHGDDIHYDLSSKRKVTIGVYEQKDVLLVHIREYEEVKGQPVATKKGIALNLEQWTNLVANIDVIHRDVTRMQSMHANRDR